MLDELACLSRDLLVMKTAGNAGITMLSGVASDQEVVELTKALSSSELVRMMNLLQSCMQSFTRSASRRMDAELCILEMCQPELNLDAKALNARLTRLEEQIKSGMFVQTAAPAPKQKAAPPEDILDEERPPLPDDADAPPEEESVAPMTDQMPIGFWSELVAAVRRELKPPAFGFFTTSPNAPVQGAMVADKLELRCSNKFIAETINKPDVLEVVARKASAQLGRPTRVAVVDLSSKPAANGKMQELLNFGRSHTDIVKIKE